MYTYQWLEELHSAHYATLLRLARNRLYSATGSTSEAEDVVQDVFLLAAEKDIRDVPNPLGWLMKTTAILCKNELIESSEKVKRSSASSVINWIKAQTAPFMRLNDKPLRRISCYGAC